MAVKYVNFSSKNTAYSIFKKNTSKYVKYADRNYFMVAVKYVKKYVKIRKKYARKYVKIREKKNTVRAY